MTYQSNETLRKEVSEYSRHVQGITNNKEALQEDVDHHAVKSTCNARECLLCTGPRLGRHDNKYDNGNRWHSKGEEQRGKSASPLGQEADFAKALPF